MPRRWQALNSHCSVLPLVSPKNLSKAGTIEPCLFVGWKPVSKCMCVRQRENCLWLMSGGSDSRTVFCTQKSPFCLSPSRTRHWETTLREGLRLQHFPRLSEYIDFATTFCSGSFLSKENKTKMVFRKKHVLSLQVGTHPFHFLHPLPFSRSSVEPHGHVLLGWQEKICVSENMQH